MNSHSSQLPEAFTQPHVISVASMNSSLDKPCKHCKRRHQTSCWLIATLLSILAFPVDGWGYGGNSNSGSALDALYYGNTFTQDWLYDSKSIAIKVEGCVWGYVADSEEVGCLQDDSEDGLTNWYMMANCRRPQVAYSVYASSSSSTSCNSANFKGSVSIRSHQLPHYLNWVSPLMSMFSMLLPLGFQSLFTTSKPTTRISITKQMITILITFQIVVAVEMVT